MNDDPSMHDDGAPRPSKLPPLARAGIALFIGAILFAAATMMILPALENTRYSEISRPDVVNRRGEPILVYSIDAAGGEVHTARIEPGASQKMFLARGMLGDEFVTRTIHVVVVGVRGAEIGRATLTGEVAEGLGYLVVDQSLEFRGFDNKVIEVVD
jgi:hypothetical protein